jgi:hypothetical protein
MSRILFVMLHPGFVRYYEDALLALAAAGHEVELAFEISRSKLGESETARQLAARSPRITCSAAPVRTESVRTFVARSDRTATRSGGAARSLFDPEARADAWESAATTVRLLRDYLRYFDPIFDGAESLRSRAEKRLPRVYRSLGRGVGHSGVPARRVFDALLRGAEEIVPANPDVEAFIRERNPDLLLVTPLIELGSQQVDYVKCARRLGVRSALCVASWDNLTSKGLIRVVPDHVVVWNEAQKREATSLHGVRPEQVVVTGAQVFDRWFDERPRRDREEFCQRIGVDPARPLILYVGSSTFIAPDEVPFAERWLEALRAAADPRLAGASVLIRPHPANADQWRAFDRAAWPNVGLWPPIGTDPTSPDFRSDFFDSLYHSAAVVGINTSAQIEAAILGRPVLTVRAPEFAHAQAGTLHFQHLVAGDSAMVQSADSLEAHVAQLAHALADPGAAAAADRRFVERFIRPHGIDRPAVPIFVGAIESLAALPALSPAADRAWVRAVRGPSLLLAWTARELADDRPLWVYACRPFVTSSVWIAAGVVRTREAWREQGRIRVKRLHRAAHRASYEGRQRLARRVRRATKPIAAVVRGAARRLARRGA